jgi:hypothetical protein
MLGEHVRAVQAHANYVLGAAEDAGYEARIYVGEGEDPRARRTAVLPYALRAVPSPQVRDDPPSERLDRNN